MQSIVQLQFVHLALFVVLKGVIIKEDNDHFFSNMSNWFQNDWMVVRSNVSMHLRERIAMVTNKGSHDVRVTLELFEASFHVVDMNV